MDPITEETVHILNHFRAEPDQKTAPEYPPTHEPPKELATRTPRTGAFNRLPREAYMVSSCKTTEKRLQRPEVAYGRLGTIEETRECESPAQNSSENYARSSAC